MPRRSPGVPHERDDFGVCLCTVSGGHRLTPRLTNIQAGRLRRCRRSPDALIAVHREDFRVAAGRPQDFVLHIWVARRDHDVIARELTGINSENAMKEFFYDLRDAGVIGRVPGKAGNKSAWQLVEPATSAKTPEPTSTAGSDGPRAALPAEASDPRSRYLSASGHDLRYDSQDREAGHRGPTRLPVRRRRRRRRGRGTMTRSLTWSETQSTRRLTATDGLGPPVP